MKRWFDEMPDRKGISVKYDKMGLLHPSSILPEEAIPMWIADMDFACPEEVLEALRDRTFKKTLGYEDPLTQNFLSAISNWWSNQHNWSVLPQWLVTCSGAIQGIQIGIQSFSNPGDGVMIQTPVYGPFAATIEKNHRVVVKNALCYEDGRYKVDFQDLEKKAADPQTKLLVFCNPHNPVGRVWTPEELKQICEICARHQVLIISDEVHSDLIRHEYTYTPMGKIGGNHVITCTTAGKAFNLSGLHLATIIIEDEELRKRFLEIRGRAFPDPFSAAATEAAYTKCEQWHRALTDYLDQSFLLLEEGVKSALPKAYLVKCEGTFLAWIDMRGYGRSDEEICRLFVEEAGVIPDPGTHFGNEGAGFVRLNIACPHWVLRKALARLQVVFENL